MVILLRWLGAVLALSLVMCSSVAAQTLELQPRLTLGTLSFNLPTASLGLRAQLVRESWGAYASAHTRAVPVLSEDSHSSDGDGGLATELSIGLTAIASDSTGATGYLLAGGGLLGVSGELFVEGEIGLRAPVGRAFGWLFGVRSVLIPRRDFGDYWLLEAVLGASVRIRGGGS